MKLKGFTLTEILIALAISAIFLSLAYKGGEQRMLTTYRLEAQTRLFEMLPQLQRCIEQQEDEEICLAQLPKQINKGYLLEASLKPLRVIAQPINKQRKDKCGALTLFKTGLTLSDEHECW